MNDTREGYLEKTVACLAEGQLWLWRGEDERLEQIQSEFGANLKEKLLKMKQKHEWKSQGTGASFMAGGGGGALWGAASNHDPSNLQVAITGVTEGAQAGELFFIMQADDVCGLFSYDVAKSEEQRLHHGTEQVIHAINYSDREEALICSVSGKEGLHNLALFKPQQGGGFRELTEGDSLDTYPRWVPGKRQVVFQTAGIGRNRAGIWVETAPCEIASLDFASGEIATLKRDSAHDFLLPQVDDLGNLYCIRRPYQRLSRVSFATTVKDVLLFPFRLLQGIFGFLNFFTSAFTGKPLTSASGPQSASSDAKRLVLYGNLVDAEKVAREYSDLSDDDSRAAVPRSWELMRYPEIGDPEVVATGVIAYTLERDGKMIFSNGRSVFRVGEVGEKPEKLSNRSLIQQLASVS